jgi:hypothetical protein
LKFLEWSVIAGRPINSNITAEATPFNGMELEWDTIEELAQIYEYDAQTEMGPCFHTFLIVLRDLFFDRFGDDADVWWDYYKSTLNRLREKGFFVDHIFLLMGLAFCEGHWRAFIKKTNGQYKEVAEKILKALDSLDSVGKYLSDVVLPGIGTGVRWKKLMEEALKMLQIAERMQKLVEMYNLDEPEGKSPLLHLVNIKTVDIFLEKGCGKNQAYQNVARLYIGFDFFSDEKFSLKNLREGDKEQLIENEVSYRSNRVKSNYNQWKNQSQRLIERLKYDYTVTEE